MVKMFIILFPDGGSAHDHNWLCIAVHTKQRLAACPVCFRFLLSECSSPVYSRRDHHPVSAEHTVPVCLV